MKIILHGATNGSNFGDFLFADIFLKEVMKHNNDGQNLFLEFPKYGIGEYFREGLNYNNKQTFKDLLDAEMLVYFSGGYFGEKTSSLRESARRFVRYLPIGLYFAVMKKPILILGVGGGPITNKLLRKSFCGVLNKAKAITFRDKETADFFESYGVNNEMIITSDTAQVINKDWLPKLDENVNNKIQEIFKNKKIIFLHVVTDKGIDNVFSESVVSALNTFLEKNKNYGVVIGYDVLSEVPIESLLSIKNIRCDSIYIYNYTQPWQLCSLINEVDMVITPKLHVGIIGATLSKSVLSFPLHSEKTKRYYRQIKESNRCLPLKDLSSDQVLELIINHHDKKINLDTEIINLANKNLNILENEILKRK